MPGFMRALAGGFLVVLGLVSCDNSQLPTLSPPNPTGRSSITLSGVVFHHTSTGTLPGANIRLLVHAWKQDGTSNVFLDVISDSMGRYSLSGVPRGSISIGASVGSGYYTPCPAGWAIVDLDQVFDVHVVSAALLSSSGAPADTPRNGGIWISGMVFERTSQGKEPIAGATVNFGGDESDPRVGSTTLTDAAGRYVVCPPLPSTGGDTYATVRVSREGYRPASTQAFLGWDWYGVDIELSRK